MTDKALDIRISVLEQKFDQIITVISDLKNAIEEMNKTFIKEYQDKLSMINTDLALLKQKSDENTKKIWWMSWVLRSFMSIIGLAVLWSILSSVIK